MGDHTGAKSSAVGSRAGTLCIVGLPESDGLAGSWAYFIGNVLELGGTKAALWRKDASVLSPAFGPRPSKARTWKAEVLIWDGI